MSIETKTINDVLVISILQNLNIETAPVMEEKIITILKKNMKTDILINLEEVESINSTGLKIFVRMYDLNRGSGNKIKICNANEMIKKLFEIARLDEIFEIHNSEDKAISSF